MSKKTILLRDLIKRLAQSEAGEIYVEVEETEPDVFVIPLTFLGGLSDSTGVINQLAQSGGALKAIPHTLAIVDIDAVLGNGTVPVGAAAEVWEVRAITATSAAGGNYAVEDDGVRIGAVVAIGAAATAELVAVPLPVSGGSLIGIEGGLIGDAFNIRAIRL